jgi:hypothetical protein
MISLSMCTVHMCGHAMGQAPLHWDYYSVKRPLERTKCPTSSTNGVHQCVQSEWGDENNIDHEESKCEIDSLIEELVPQAMAMGLQMIQEYHAQIQKESRLCIVI